MKAKILSIAAATGLIVGSTAIVHAQQSGAPGQRMQGGGMSGPATPRHEMQERGSRSGEPGRDREGTSGFGDRDDAVRGGRDRDDRLRGDGDRDERLRGDRDGRLRRDGDRDDRRLDRDRDDDER
jgi:hypothetical protein